MEAQVYSVKGATLGKVKLPEKVFGLAWNADLVHQVATSLAMSRRKPYAHTKNRGDVRGGGKKPWKQKGLGRARHGSIRSPIWVGGGVAHGPRKEKNFERKVSKKMKEKALYTLLSRKFKDGEVLFVENIKFEKPKTKDAVTILSSLSTIKGFEKLSMKKKNAALIALSERDTNVSKSLSNIGHVEAVEVRNLSPLALLNYKFLIIEDPEKALKNIPSHGQGK